MKSRWLIITLIILLTIIIIGLIGILVFFLNGKINFGRGFMNSGRKSTNVVLDEKYKVSDINDIEIIQDAGDITFEKSLEDNIRIVAYGESRDDLNVGLNDKKLKIDYQVHAIKWFNFNSYINDIIVYIPENYSNEVNIKNDYGNCKITDLNNAIINLDADCGNIELGEVKNVKIKSDYGNIDIKSVLNKCDIESDCGNVKIEKAYIQENSSIKSDYGNVDIKEINDIYVDTEVDLGSAKINKNNRQSNIVLKIIADLGTVTVGE